MDMRIWGALALGLMIGCGQSPQSTQTKEKHPQEHKSAEQVLSTFCAHLASARAFEVTVTRETDIPAKEEREAFVFEAEYRLAVERPNLVSLEFVRGFSGARVQCDGRRVFSRG